MLQYNLPHPLYLLDHPPTKETYKRLVKAKVTDYWELKLRAESSLLPSLRYYQPQYYSLRTPHKLFIAAGPKSYEVAKAKIQLQFLASQYPCAKYTRHWSPDNKEGLCTVPVCYQNKLVESPEHILLSCPAYASTRLDMSTLCSSLQNQVSLAIVSSALSFNSVDRVMQLLLDPSVIP